MDKYKIYGLIIGAIIPILFDKFIKIKKEGWLFTLDKQLKFETSKTKSSLKNKLNPIITICFQYLYFIVPFLSISIPFFIWIRYGWDYSLLWFFLPISLMFILYCFEHKKKKPLKQNIKSLIGVISNETLSIKASELPNKDCIFFASHDGKFEARKPITDESEIDKIRSTIIKPYYEKLQEEIEQGIKERKLRDSIFKYGDGEDGVLVCDYLLNKVYTTDNLREHILMVKNNLKTDHSINFIGNKIGVSGYKIINNELTLEIYLTDHFTFKVFKEIFKNKKYKDFFQEILGRLNFASDEEKPFIIKTFKYLFSSFGTDVVISGRMANGERGLLLALRNGDIEKSRESKIHVPVNESFSNTDTDSNIICYNLRKCVARGIEEEIGINQDVIDGDKCRVSFTDFAVVCDEGEIGIACYVDLSLVMPLEQVRMYPAQDKSMEIKDLLIVPYPRFYCNPEKYKTFFYKESKSDAFCFVWESFTPYLYQRFIIRDRELHPVSSWVLNLALTLIFLINLSYALGNAVVYTDLFFSSLSMASATISDLIIFRKQIRRYKRKKYKLFKPLVPQFNGDVAIIQSISSTNHETIKEKGGSLFNDIYLGCVTKMQKTKLDDLFVVEKPYCKTRREGVYNYTEIPISYFRMVDRSDAEKRGINLNENKLFFKYIPCQLINDKTLLVWCRVEIKDEKKNKDPHYSFSVNINPSELSFEKNKDVKADLITNFSTLSECKSVDFKTAVLHQLTMYRPLDLFYYCGNYYWSLDMESLSDEISGESSVIKITDKTDIYNDYISKSTKDTNYIFEGTVDDVIHALVRFIKNNKNRSRISPLDIYALQMTLIRKGMDKKGVVLAEIVD